MMIRRRESCLPCIALSLLLSFAGSSAETDDRASKSESASSIRQIVNAHEVNVNAVCGMSDGAGIASKVGGRCDTTTTEEAALRIIPKMAHVFKVVTATTAIRIVEIGKARFLEAVVKHVRHVTYSLPRYVKTTTRRLLSHGSEMLDVFRVSLDASIQDACDG